MNSKKQLYKFVGIFTAIVYLIIVVATLFELEDFKFLNVTTHLLAIFLAPAIYLLFAGIGELLDSNSNEKEEIAEKEEEKKEDEPVQMELDLDGEEKTETEEKTEKEYPYEAEIKDGKIRCRYCGKYNKLKRTYCYMCARKLRDDEPQEESTDEETVENDAKEETEVNTTVENTEEKDKKQEKEE